MYICTNKNEKLSPDPPQTSEAEAFKNKTHLEIDEERIKMNFASGNTILFCSELKKWPDLQNGMKAVKISRHHMPLPRMPLQQSRRGWIILSIKYNLKAEKKIYVLTKLLMDFWFSLLDCCEKIPLKVPWPTESQLWCWHICFLVGVLDYLLAGLSSSLAKNGKWIELYGKVSPTSINIVFLFEII